MKRTIVRIRNSPLRKFIRRHEKYAPVLFFIGGFIFDWMTLGRIDRLYDLIVLCSHMTLLSLTLYLFNRAEDGIWKGTLLERFREYFPLAIQFFFGALSSAYVVYFSRSVSLSKTFSFFVILVLLLLANEFLKQRIANKYLQFGVYSFLSFTFFTFIVPVFTCQMDTMIFLISGVSSLIVTLTLVSVIYFSSPSTRVEVNAFKLYALILFVYSIMTLFYFMKLIPPVPLALDTGMVAHNVEVRDNRYFVSYESNEWYVFWRQHRLKYIHHDGHPVYVYSSIFAPTDLKKSIMHRWNRYNQQTEEWETTDTIAYDIQGGRNRGFRGFTYKNNISEGTWKVEVVTEEELVIGVIDFEIITNEQLKPHRMVERAY